MPSAEEGGTFDIVVAFTFEKEPLAIWLTSALALSLITSKGVFGGVTVRTSRRVESAMTPTLLSALVLCLVALPTAGASLNGAAVDIVATVRSNGVAIIGRFGPSAAVAGLGTIDVFVLSTKAVQLVAVSEWCHAVAIPSSARKTRV